MTPVEKVINIALAEVGYKEKASNSMLDDKAANPGVKNYNKYARDLDKMGDVYNYPKQGFGWCDIFVDWCFVKAFGHDAGLKAIFQPLKGCGAGPEFSYAYYKNRGFVYHDPEPGDQIFFSRDGGETVYHTGLVVKVVGNIVYTVEGNVEVDGVNGVGERAHYKHATNILGYGRPDFSHVPTEEEPAPWYADCREWAIKARLTAKGDRPDESMTRAEVWATLKQFERFLKEGGEN